MILIICCTIGMSLLSTSKAMSWQDRNNFLGDFITLEDRPAAMVSFVNETMTNKVYLHKSWYNISRLAIQKPKTLRRRVLVDDNVIYICNLTEDTVWSLIEAQKLRILKTPSRWLLFYSFKKPVPMNSENFTTEVDLSEPTQAEILDLDNEKRGIESLLEDVYVSLDSEVYVVIEHPYELRIFLVHRLRPQLPLIWDEYGTWDQTTGLYKIAHRETIPMRRKNINRLDIYAAAFFELNNTMDHLRDYLYRHIDTPAKISYYMTMHLFDWLNATGHINMTDSYGYLQKDGSYNGASRELIDERSEFSATVMLFSRQRMEVIEYMLSPCRGDVKFMFRKPSLASVANIYALPFSRGVWLSVLVLIAVLTSLLFLASGWEKTIVDAKIATTPSQRLSQCLHDTLCLAFQQGTAVDPIVLSGRQVLFIGLMSFMFLYTAYSAFVVALLQSATNDINSVEAILNSPLQILAQQRPYSKLVFQYDNRPAHRALWLKKGAPQGENFFVSVEEGVRKIREGLYAFHVEETSGYDFIQKTFLEHEKCNLGTVKFMADNYPSTLIAKESFVKEPLRVGTLRVFESGLQSRSCRRAVPKPPQCAATTAMFTPVTLQVALPVFKYFFIVCASTFVILGLEIYVHRYEQKRKSKGTAVDVVASPDSELE